MHFLNDERYNFHLRGIVPRAGFQGENCPLIPLLTSITFTDFIFFSRFLPRAFGICVYTVYGCIHQGWKLAVKRLGLNLKGVSTFLWKIKCSFWDIMKYVFKAFKLVFVWTPYLNFWHIVFKFGAQKPHKCWISSESKNYDAELW